jgi:hypothetical protein
MIFLVAFGIFPWVVAAPQSPQSNDRQKKGRVPLPMQTEPNPHKPHAKHPGEVARIMKLLPQQHES